MGGHKKKPSGARERDTRGERERLQKRPPKIVSRPLSSPITWQPLRDLSKVCAGAPSPLACLLPELPCFLEPTTSNYLLSDSFHRVLGRI